MSDSKIVCALEEAIFAKRPIVIAIFAALTAFMLYSAITGLHIDAGFEKTKPRNHEYMKTYSDYADEYGGANRILVALVARDGDIFSEQFFAALKEATDEVFFLPGVDRSRVSSLFTPNVRFTEVTEEGIAGGNVVPADFSPTPEGLAQVRQNILQSSIVGRLVANDFSGAIISAELLEINPDTGEALDYVAVSHLLEEKIREKFDSDFVDYEVDSNFSGLDVHIIGFAKVIGDISDGAQMVLVFFLAAFLITALLVLYYTQSIKLAIIPLLCSLVAVVWQLGLLTLLGFGIDPMGILVPFLVFAIGVSHGVQMVSAVRAEVFMGASPQEAACASFRKLLLPGIIALVSDTIGFITILMIDIGVIQEMAITASLGVAVIILTNLVLLPVLVSYVSVSDAYKAKLLKRADKHFAFWKAIAKATTRGPATAILAIAVALAIFGYWQGSGIKIGDLHEGVPELRGDSRYNLDSKAITNHFSIGVDIITAIVEAPAQSCVEYPVISAVDEFAWYMENDPGVQSVMTLSKFGKVINAGWNEGNMKWRVLSRNSGNLVQSFAFIDTSSGLLNDKCDALPVMMFTKDHKAETIEHIVNRVKYYRDNMASPELNNIRLATGNVGVMAATNEEVSAAQFPILFGVFGAIILLCWLAFRSFRAVLCIVLPLALVSLLAYALMTWLEIGLKVSTLPVVALGVGIGVDYGIYIFSRLRDVLREEGLSLHDAYLKTLSITGAGVVFTGFTLAIGVATWIFSPLKFQADMGLLLTFMFLVNMLGAILVLPALAYWLIPRKWVKQV